MLPKAKQGASEKSGLSTKPYREILSELFSGTAVTPRDIDQKALALFDALHEKGKVPQAVRHLQQSLDGIPREKVSAWKAYVYTLLKSFDKETYDSMKGRSSRKRSEKKAVTTFNVHAAEFVPGQMWQAQGNAPQMLQMPMAHYDTCAAVAVLAPPDPPAPSAQPALTPGATSSSEPPAAAPDSNGSPAETKVEIIGGVSTDLTPPSDPPGVSSEEPVCTGVPSATAPDAKDNPAETKTDIICGVPPDPTLASETPALTPALAKANVVSDSTQRSVASCQSVAIAGVIVAFSLGLLCRKR